MNLLHKTFIAALLSTLLMSAVQAENSPAAPSIQNQLQQLLDTRMINQMAAKDSSAITSLTADEQAPEHHPMMVTDRRVAATLASQATEVLVFSSATTASML